MSDRISPEERAALLAFKGTVTKCPEGAALFASYVSAAAGGYHSWLADMGIMVTPHEMKWYPQEKANILGLDSQNWYNTVTSNKLRLEDETMRLADKGLSYEEIAERMGMGATKGAVAMAIWRIRTKRAA